MAEIKIEDLPKRQKIRKADMKGIIGGVTLTEPLPDLSLIVFLQFEEGNIQFKVATPNEDGASKLNIKL